jgi:hypothetical protein
VHWIADVSLPLDISRANQRGEEVSADELVTSDEDSGDASDNDEKGPTAQRHANLRGRQSGTSVGSAGTATPWPAQPKAKSNPGSRLWRAEIQVSWH